MPDDQVGKIKPHGSRTPRQDVGWLGQPPFEKAGRKRHRQDDQEPDELDTVKYGDGLLLAKAGIEQLEPDLAQFLRVGGSQRLPQLAGSRGDLGLKCFLPPGQVGLCAKAERPASRRRSRSSAFRGRAATMPRIDHAPREIARNIAIGSNVSLLGIMKLHTLIATIFLITQAPKSWPMAVPVSIFTPMGVLNSSLI